MIQAGGRDLDSRAVVLGRDTAAVGARGARP